MSTQFSQTVFSPWLTPVRLISSVNIAGTYFNGSSNNGVGATLTVAATSLTIDSVVCNFGDRVLLAAQTSSNENGIYIVLSISATVVLQRAADQQSLEQIQLGQYVSTEAGLVNAGTFYTVVEPKPTQLGVSGTSYNQVVTSGGGGGTVSSGTTGQVAQYPANGATVVGATLAAGTNISITNTPGLITINASGGGSGTVNAGTANTLAYYAANGTTVSSLTMPLPTDAGGTGASSFPAYVLIAGGANPGDPLQPISGLGLAGQGLISQGPGMLPNWGNISGTTAPVTVDNIATYTNVFGGLGENPGTAFTSVNLAAGAKVLSGGNGTSGQFVAQAPTPGLGTLQLFAVDNGGAFDAVISNALQSSMNHTFIVPDIGGNASADFILTEAIATQTINSPIGLSGSNSLTVGGNVTSGHPGFGGTFIADAPTPGGGLLQLSAQDNAGNFVVNLTNEAFGQSTNVFFPDPGVSFVRVIMSSATINQEINSPLSVISGLLQVGSQFGVGGTINVFSPTSSMGRIEIIASDNAGPFVATVTNASLGQSTIYTLPDPAVSNVNFMLNDASANVMRSVASAATVGGSAAEVITDAFCTTGSVVIGNWVTQANPAQVVTIVPGAGSFTVNSTVDAGVGTFSYIITKV